MDILSRRSQQTLLVRKDGRLYQINLVQVDNGGEQHEVYEVKPTFLAQISDQNEVDNIILDLTGKEIKAQTATEQYTAPAVEIRERKRPGPKPGFKRKNRIMQQEQPVSA